MALKMVYDYKSIQFDPLKDRPAELLRGGHQQRMHPKGRFARRLAHWP